MNSARCALFMDPQISIFSNFFIKNGSYDTIHTFKNDFATVFFSFQFQFSVFTDPQISIFSNFFIKNGSYDTIHTFKNDFATVFFSFQFSAVSKWILSVEFTYRSYRIASIILVIYLF